jgi:hypothetical protein
VRRFPLIFAAILVLGLSATAAFAAGDASNVRSGHATQGAAPTIAAASPTASASPELSERAEAARSKDATESEEPEASPAAGAAAIPTTHPDNHGLEVSTAAQATTPPGFTNHGAYVSSVAHKNHGQEPKTHGKNAVTATPSPTPTPAAS